MRRQEGGEFRGVVAVVDEFDKLRGGLEGLDDLQLLVPGRGGECLQQLCEGCF